MTWHRRDLAVAGKFSAQGLCGKCGADLVVRLENKGRDGYYFCSRGVCRHARIPVPRSSALYSGPQKT